MKRSSARKGSGKSGSAGKSHERRKHPRRSGKSQAKTASQAKAADAVETCENCSQSITSDDKALFVEEEVGRIFCTEECIAEHFSTEIARLEKEYLRRRGDGDLTAEEREALDHLRWVTLQEPDEVWREKTLAGDYRYTLISEFEPGNRRVWCVCICLFLRGEPSFLYLAFPTKNEALVGQYRRGERVEWTGGAKPAQEAAAKAASATAEEPAKYMIDGLADEWTEDETFRAELTQARKDDDIPASEYALYQSCLEESLEAPDEVWSLKLGKKDALTLYHFIKFYDEEPAGVWYVVVARETEDEEQIEILDAFPTRDPDLVERYRRGNQEIGETEMQSHSRVVH